MMSIWALNLKLARAVRPGQGRHPQSRFGIMLAVTVSETQTLEGVVVRAASISQPMSCFRGVT